MIIYLFCYGCWRTTLDDCIDITMEEFIVQMNVTDKESIDISV